MPRSNAHQRTQPSRKRLGCLLLSIIALVCFPNGAGAQDVVVREAPIKAAYIYNFAKYIELPPHYEQAIGTPDRFTIAVVGSSPVTQHLNTIASRKTVNGRRVVVKQLAVQSPMPQCHLYYIASGLSIEQKQILQQELQHNCAYIVVDEYALISTANAVFVAEGNRLRFDINLSRSKFHNIRVSSQLLRLARTLYDSTGSE